MSAQLRATAATLCYQVVDQGKSLSDVLPKAQSKLANSADKALLAELCFGIMRHLPQLDFVSQQLMSKPLIKDLRPLQYLIYIGMYQLKYLRIPDYAAVGETVEAARLLKGKNLTKLINAVLREFQRRPELFEFADAPLPVQTNHPSWLVQQLQQAYPEQWLEIVAANQQKAPLWLRINVQQVSIEQFHTALADDGVEFSTPVALLPQAVLLARACDVTQLPGYDDGWFSVQDVSAQYAALLLAPQAGERVLDACCAPGGKTAHLLEQAPTAHVVALDRDEQRLQRVYDNLDRLQLHAHVIAADAAELGQWWDGQQFDRILLDVPCSAVGVIRRHPDIRWLRKKADIPALVATQQQLLQEVWRTLKPGGTLLYATCSILPEENAQQIEHFLQQTPDAQALPLAPFHPHTTWQRLPGFEDGDGFFYAKLTKKIR